MSVDFLDSNVLLYLFDETDDDKRSTSRRIVHAALADGTGLISFQVVQETLNVLTRKLGASADDARAFLETVLDPLWSVSPTADLYRSALDIRSRYRYGFYDSLIIAAAQFAEADTLLSEDLQAGQRFGKLEIVNPFA